ncbi:MAG TPA: AsmA family protein [Dongiaceae bacterium]|jgi:hypothetical protein|nr:AsmA family protein [Dongiaceae bacterium]
MPVSLRRVLAWCAWIIGGLTIVIILAVGSLLLFFNWNWLKGPAIERLSAATGRKIELGDIQGQWAWVPQIELRDIKIANAPWSKDPDMLRVGHLRFHIDLGELLKGRIVLPDLAIDDAKMVLEKNAQGEPNWKLGPSVAGAAVKATVPTERSTVPYVNMLSLTNGEIIYRDPGRQIDIDAKTRDVMGTGSTQIQLQGTGTLQGKKLDFTMKGASLAELRTSTRPYPIFLDAKLGDIHVKVDGVLNDPVNPEIMQAKFAASGNNLADIYLFTHIPLPPSPPYALSGDLKRNHDHWEVDHLEGRLGGSDIAGNASVDFGGERPLLKAAITSHRLDAKDMTSFIGAPRDRPYPTKAGNKIIPNQPIDLERLRAMDMRVSFRGQEILAPKLPLENITASISLDRGLLRLDPIAMGVAQGKVSGALVLDGRKDIPRIETNLTLSNIALKPFFQKTATKMADVTAGHFGGKIAIAGNGRTLADVAGDANGRLTLAMVGGTLDPLIVELMGLDIGQALLVAVTPTKPYTIRCMLGDFSLNKGVAKIEGLVIDTTDSNIWATGAIDLGQEKIDIHLNSDPKDVSLLSANAPVAVTGSFTGVTIAVDPTYTANKSGIEKVLGAIVNPILAVIPFVDLGLGQDTDCRHFDPQSKKPVPSNAPNAAPPK